MHRARTIAAINKAAEHLPLVEIALVFVRRDHVARLIVNANHGLIVNGKRNCASQANDRMRSCE
jgi:hypothetical protein